MTKEAWWGRVKGHVRHAPYHLRMDDLDYGYATACRGRQMSGSFQSPGTDLVRCPRCHDIYSRGKEKGLWF